MHFAVFQRREPKNFLAMIEKDNHPISDFLASLFGWNRLELLRPVLLLIVESLRSMKYVVGMYDAFSMKEYDYSNFQTF